MSLETSRVDVPSGGLDEVKPIPLGIGEGAMREGLACGEIESVIVLVGPRIVRKKVRGGALAITE